LSEPSYQERYERGEHRYPFTPYPIGWFRIAYARELGPNAVLRRHYFGRELVAFRTASGAACVADAHCPHLGAHLGVGGTVVGERIRCPFHQWEFDAATGECAAIPYAKRIPPRARLRTWPVVERNGVVFAFHHPERKPPHFDLPSLPELDDPDWLPVDVSHWTVRASWLDMNENCVDMAHFKFVHGTLTIPPTTAEIDGTTHIARSRFRMKMPGGEGDAELVTYDHGPGMQVVRMSGLIDSLMLNTCTPIDPEQTDVSFAYTVRAAGDERKERLAAAVVADLRNQFDHDRPIWENKAYWTRPALCDGDGPLSTYRRWVQQFV
jgi:phenylpropionate dioxygenase-like ring-hydroxylating dioxygenase large terminal subunit